MIKVLVVEDDDAINNLLANILNDEGYYVTQAFSGTEARFCLKEKSYEIILLDLMLPGTSGENLIEEIKEKYKSQIIVISAKSDIDSKINVLKMGADDYITKPFDQREVLARIEVVLRRFFNQDNDKKGTLFYKDIELDSLSRKVYLGDVEVLLTTKEFDILELLLTNPRKVFSKSNIFESIWKDDFLGDDNTVNVHVSNLRSKLNRINDKETYIKTVWGIGFKMDE
ncbi:response regulator transcription factor [Clostridium sp. B9]|uniref:response regulator transcription factor n=1 Tax=Clostridium sp. B9 TaxID=3423224 RepID=UPI003D2F3AE2